MIYNVVFSLGAAAELIRIMGELQAADVMRASQAIRQALEIDPANEGIALPEGLYYIDRESLRAFFEIDVPQMTASHGLSDFVIFNSPHSATPTPGSRCGKLRPPSRACR